MAGHKFQMGKKIAFSILTLLWVLVVKVPTQLYAVDNPEKIRVGIFQNKPICFFDDQGRAQGIYPDLIRKIAQKEGWNLSFVDGTWSENLESLKEAQIDLMVAIVYSEERDRIYDFSSEPVITTWGEVYTAPDSDIRQILDLGGKTIVTMEKDINAKHFKDLCRKFNLECRFKGVGTYEDVCRFIIEGQADAGVINNINGEFLKRKFTIAGTPIMFSPITGVFAVPENRHQILIEKIDEYMTSARADQNSDYYLILNKWYGNIQQNEKYDVKLILAIVGLAGGLLICIILWTQSLKKQVLVRTRDLSRSESQARAMFEHMSSGAAVYEVVDQGEDFIFKEFNPSAEQMTGNLRNEVLGKRLSEVFPGMDQIDFLQALKRVWQTGMPERLEPFHYVDESMDGWFENRIYRLPSGEVVALFDNVSERKNTERALMESEEKYRSIMESMDDSIYICAPDFTISYMNSAMIKKTGWDATGERCYKIIHDLEKRCPWCCFDRVTNGEVVKTELVNPKDKRVYHISHSPVFHSDGSVSKLTGFRDITEIKEMETRLQQSHKMEAIGTLAGGIAHDFNNILFPILGYTEILMQDIPKDSPSYDYLTAVHQGAVRASELVHQILTFSRQENNKVMLIKLQPIVKEAVKFMRSSIPKNIDIQQTIITDCGPVKADPTQFHQVVMNLVTNAFHAVEKVGGRIDIRLEPVALEKEDHLHPDLKPGPHVCLTVADTGVGMNKKVVDKIFDPFFTTKDKGKGTGMGLSVVHGIVKSMDGVINVFSEPDQGSRFSIYLPVEKTVWEDEVMADPSPLEYGSEHILLVDDEEAIVTMEKEVLERLGYRVTTRTSPLEALAAFRESTEQYDLVITDYAMPNMRGDELAKKMNALNPGIPILLCTGFSETLTREQMASCGIGACLLKPVIIRDISKSIRKILEKTT